MFNSNLIKRLLVVLFTVGIYRALFYIPIPFLDLNFSSFDFSVAGNRHFSIISLGLGPLLVGFFITELLTYIIPWLKRKRTGGIVGREKLNSISLWISLGIGLWQAINVATTFSANPQTFFPHSSILFVFVTVATLMAGVVLVFTLVNLITKHGIGNGICVLFVFDTIISLVEHFKLFVSLEVAKFRILPLAVLLRPLWLFSAYIKGRR